MNLALPILFCGTNATCGAIFDGENTYHKIMCVNNAKAKVANLKFINVKGRYGDDSGGLWLYGGMVSNCIFSVGSADGAGMVRQMGGLVCDTTIENSYAGTHSGGDRFGGGLYMLGGTAERLVIQGCTDGAGGAVRLNGASAILRNSVIQGNYSETGGAVLLDDGLVENCIISNNTGKSIAGSLVTFAAGPGATVRGGTLRNCLVVDNRMTSANGSGGALHVVSGAAYNNTVWGNTLYSGATNDIGQTGGTVANSIAGVFEPSGGTQAGNYVGFGPGFANLSVGDFSLTGDSPCLDIGDWTFWGETRGAAKAAKDMAGNSRLCGHSVDAGCYECAARGFILCVR